MKINPLDFNKTNEMKFSKTEESFDNCIFYREDAENIDQIGDTLTKTTVGDKETSSDAILQNQLPQSIVSTRKDGIVIEIGDNYAGSIPNDDNGKFINTHGSYEERIDSYLKIKDKNGKEYELGLIINGNSDLIDLRRQTALLMDYLKELPSDILLKIANYDSLEANPPLTEDDPFYELYSEILGGKTEGIDFPEEEELSAVIFTSKIVLPPREFKKDFEGERKDGYKIKITNIDERTFALQVKTPNGEEHELQIRGIEAYTSDVKFYRETLPLFIKFLGELPATVLEDFVNEISVIHLNNNYGGAAGQYFRGTNEITVSFNWQMDSESRNAFAMDSFIHEIGHAIDAVSGEYATDASKDFIAQFEELKEILQNRHSDDFALNPSTMEIHRMALGEEHSFTDAQEMFAILYNKQQTGSLKHIESLEKYINAFASNSTDPEEKRAVELYRLLNENVQKIVNERRNLPKSMRCDEELANFVKSKITNDVFNNYAMLVNNNLAHYNPGLEFLDLVDMVFINNKEFTAIVKSINNVLTSEEYGDKYPSEVKEAFEKLMLKLLNIREEVKEFQQNRLSNK